MVKNESATLSGLSVIPVMAMIAVASLSSGIYIGKTGNYRFIPAIGFACVMLGTGSLSVFCLVSCFPRCCLLCFCLRCLLDAEQSCVYSAVAS